MPTGYPDYQAPTNLVAQDVAELSTDVNTTKLDDLGIDVQSQTITELDMDIASQSASELITFTLQGTVVGGSREYTVSANSSLFTTVSDIAADERGTLLYGILYVDTAATGSHTVLPALNIDGAVYPSGPATTPRVDYSYYDKIGCANADMMNLLKYNVDGKCSVLFRFPNGVDYDDTVETYFDNPTGSDLTCGHLVGIGVL